MIITTSCSIGPAHLFTSILPHHAVRIDIQTPTRTILSLSDAVNLLSIVQQSIISVVYRSRTTWHKPGVTSTMTAELTTPSNVAIHSSRHNSFMNFDPSPYISNLVTETGVHREASQISACFMSKATYTSHQIEGQGNIRHNPHHPRTVHATAYRHVLVHPIRHTYLIVRFSVCRCLFVRSAGA